MPKPLELKDFDSEDFHLDVSEVFPNGDGVVASNLDWGADRNPRENRKYLREEFAGLRITAGKELFFDPETGEDIFSKTPPKIETKGKEYDGLMAGDNGKRVNPGEFYARKYRENVRAHVAQQLEAKLKGNVIRPWWAK